jgi:serine/threonine protein kinase
LDISKEFLDFFSRIFEKNSSNRITCEEILNHPWIKNENEINGVIENFSKKINIENNTNKLFDDKNEIKK